MIGNGFKPGFLPEGQWIDENFDTLAISVPGNNLAPKATGVSGTNLFMAGFENNKVNEANVSGKEINHDWEVGTPIYPHAHVVKAVAGAGNVRLGFEYRVLRHDMTPIYDTILETFAVPGTELVEEIIVNFGAIDLSAVDDVGAQVTFRFFRLGADDLDTYGGTILVPTFGWHYKVDTNGSRTIGSK